MDVLINKSSESKNYLSRYSNFPYYFHTIDNKHVQGLGAQLNADTASVTIVVDQSMTLDSLANKYYGRPDYWWIIADFNRIQDPFLAIYPKYKTLKIPSINAIEFIEDAQR